MGKGGARRSSTAAEGDGGGCRRAGVSGGGRLERTSKGGRAFWRLLFAEKATKGKRHDLRARDRTTVAAAPKIIVYMVSLSNSGKNFSDLKFQWAPKQEKS